MNSSQEHIPSPEAERGFDLIVCGLTGIVSGSFTERIIDYIQTKPPEWGGAVSGLGFVAVTFAGIAAHHWNKAVGASPTGAERPHPQAEK